MEQRTSAPARIIAALALVGAVIVIVVAIAGSIGGDGSSSEHHRNSARTTKHHHQQENKPPPASYTIQTGDTLTSIAHATGVPVATIIALNPEVDPQILIAGEKLKLR